MKNSILALFVTVLFISVEAQTIQFTNQIVYDDYPTVKTPKTSFSQDEAIYGVAKFKDAIINMPIAENPGTTVQIGYFVSIDGQVVISNEKGSFAQVVPGAMFSREYNDVYSNQDISIVLKPSDDDRFKNNILKQGSMKVFMPALSKAGLGKHTIKVDIRFMDDGKISEPISSGSFEINITKAIKWESASRFPSAKKNDPALVQSMITALKNNNWNYTVKKINIVESDWEIHKNAFGAITHRSIDTYVGFIQTDKTCKVFNISFKQIYANGYGKTQVNGTGQSYEVDCSEIK